MAGGGMHMPETAVSAPGKPAWADLSTTDAAAGKTFYSKLFGWQPEDQGPDAGGTVALEPMDVLGQGSMAVFQDPIGAFISVWQPAKMKGFDVTNQPNSFAWAELNGRGVEKTKPFYKKVFGWGDKTSPMGEGQPPYTEWQLGGESIGGGMEMGKDMPTSVPSFWLVYFGVADVDATAKKAG